MKLRDLPCEKIPYSYCIYGLCQLCEAFIKCEKDVGERASPLIVAKVTE